MTAAIIPFPARQLPGVVLDLRIDFRLPAHQGRAANPPVGAAGLAGLVPAFFPLGAGTSHHRFDLLLGGCAYHGTAHSVPGLPPSCGRGTAKSAWYRSEAIS